MEDAPKDARRAERRRLVLRSEFAAVSVELVGEPGRERLRIEDLRSRQVVHLDALELESLAWCRHRDLSSLLDPGALRWPSGDEASPSGDDS